MPNISLTKPKTSWHFVEKFFLDRETTSYFAIFLLNGFKYFFVFFNENLETALQSRTATLNSLSDCATFLLQLKHFVKSIKFQTDPLNILISSNIYRRSSYLYAPDVEPVRQVNVPISSSRGRRIPDTYNLYWISCKNKGSFASS